MKKLNIKLNKDYKSFKAGFSYEFEGDLIILSGINGAGKSQLIDIITSNMCQSYIDTISVSEYNIDNKSFKTNISISEISEASSKVALQLIDDICLDYGASKTDETYLNNKIKNILINKFGEETFFEQKITDDEIKQTLIAQDVIIKSNDSFSNTIGEIFFSHALQVSEEMKNIGRNNFKETNFKKAPWKELNELFEELKFDYRFENNYEIVGVEIDKQPKIYPLNSNNTLNMDTPRRLSDLSDGEKTIISLCFNALENTDTDTKILLLDEIDATLNPSLIDSFFKVIERYYIDKGIMVVLTTHSSATIALAPEYANFYEVFKANSSSTRILQVNKENEYSEMKKVNEKFYTQIANQEERINQLKAKIDSKEEILIITEGKTDWKYILKALQYFHSIGEFKDIKEEYFYRFGSQEDVNNEVCGTTSINELSESKLLNYLKSLQSARKIDIQTTENIRIGIFDSDTNIKSINDKKLNIYSLKIVPDNISTEFLFSDDEIKSEIEGKRLYIGTEFDQKHKQCISGCNLGGCNNNLSKAGKNKIIDCDVFDNSGENVACFKERFAQAVYNNEITISPDSWDKFKHIFEKISSILKGVNR